MNIGFIPSSKTIGQDCPNFFFIVGNRPVYVKMHGSEPGYFAKHNRCIKSCKKIIFLLQQTSLVKTSPIFLFFLEHLLFFESYFAEITSCISLCVHIEGKMFSIV